MQILITTDDGPGAYGLTLLEEAVRRQYKEAKIVVMTTHENQMGQSMSLTCRPPGEMQPYKKVDTNLYEVEGRPLDILYLAFLHPHLFLTAGTFDTVFCGVNHGANTGSTVFHSGTVGVAMMAATYFNAAAFSFSQECDPHLPVDLATAPTIYGNAARLLGECLKTGEVGPGECMNINFPSIPAKGIRSCRVAPYSTWKALPHIPPTDKMTNDIELLKQGFVTISELELRVNPAMRY